MGRIWVESITAAQRANTTQVIALGPAKPTTTCPIIQIPELVLVSHQLLGHNIEVKTGRKIMEK